MPIEMDTERVALRGRSTIDDAERLHERLLAHERAEIDVTPLEHPHAAVLQVLMAVGCALSALPDDAFSAECLRQVRR